VIVEVGTQNISSLYFTTEVYDCQNLLVPAQSREVQVNSPALRIQATTKNNTLDCEDIRYTITGLTQGIEMDDKGQITVETIANIDQTYLKVLIQVGT